MAVLETAGTRWRQLKLLLWKNYLLKRRRPGAAAVEILVPLVLFLVLAAIRQSFLAEDVSDTVYNTHALPGAGALAFAQSLYCGGIRNFDIQDGPATGLDEVAAILQNSSITPERLLEILRNTTLDLEDLNRTITDLNLGDNAQLSDLQREVEALELDLPTLTLDTDRGTGGAGINTDGSGDGTVTLLNQTELRANLRIVCEWVQSPQFDDFETQIEAIEGFRNGSSLAQGFLNISRLLESDNPAGELLDQWRQSPAFINTTAPSVLRQFNDSFPDQVQLTDQNVADIQDILRESGDAPTARTNLLDYFDTSTNVNPVVASAIVASLIGLGSFPDTQGAINDFANSSNVNASAVPQTAVPTLQEELDRLQRDFDEINDAQETLNQILDVEAVQNLRDGLQQDNPDLELLWEQFACTAEQIDEAAIPDLRRRRSTSDATDGVRSPSAAHARSRRLDQEEQQGSEAEENPDMIESDVASVSDITSFESILSLVQDMKIYYAPDIPQVREIIRVANKTLDEAATLIQLADCLANLTNASIAIENDVDLDLWVGFETEDDLVRAAQGRENLATVMGGVVFYPDANGEFDPEHIRIALRFHHLKVPPTDELQPRYTRTDAGGFENAQYYYLGFVLVQDLIERAVASVFGDEGYIAAPALFVQRFPIPEHREDFFSFAISRTLPLFLTLGFIYSVSMIVKNIVYEKEHRLKEAMKMMGLPGWVHWLAWFITSVAFLNFSVFLLAVVLVGGGVLANSDFFLIYLFFLVFAIATIAFSFLISTFFSKARLAAACAGIVYFVTYLPYIFVAVNDETMSAGEKYFASLLSTTAFGIASAYVARYEEVGEGLQWHNYHKPLGNCDNFSFNAAIWMMVFDTLLYIALTFYIEAVFPGEFGLPKHPLFFLQPSYWCGERFASTSSSAAAGGGGQRYEMAGGSSDDARFEAMPPTLDVGVEIKELVKVYGSRSLCGTRAPDKRAVDSLSIGMCKGHITSLLGHNGAGKSTTLNILTGLFPPTSGTAVINGHDIRTDMADIRSSLGICPQYNVLFDRLTVMEHLIFAGAIKGLTAAEARAEAIGYLQDINLADKQDTWSTSLSGGMKRKLSVAMAFIGDSQTVILDEPTAGMDPSARRSTWDLLLKYRKSRTILLSTHHMDEADLLSDRIAIIARGRLRCAGSSMFLKKYCGAGYTVTFVTGEGCDRHALVDLVRSIIPDARVVDDVGQEVAISLPLSESSHFQHLFEQLEKAQSEIGFEAYGISATTLEDVFLRIAETSELEDSTTASLSSAAKSSSRLGAKAAYGPRRNSISSLNSDTALLDADMSFDPEGDDVDNSAMYGGEDEAPQMETHGRDSPDGPGYLTVLPSQPSVPTGDELEASLSTAPDPEFGGFEESAATKAAWGPAAQPARELHRTSTQSSLDSGLYSGPTLTGLRLWGQRFRAIFVKRFHNAKRDRRAVTSQIVLPAVFVLLGMIVATAFPPPGDLPALSLVPSTLSQVCAGEEKEAIIPFANTDERARSYAIEQMFNQIPEENVNVLNLTQDALYLGPAQSNYSQYMLDTYHELSITRRVAASLEQTLDSAVSVSAGLNTVDVQGEVGRGWYDNRHFHSMPIAVGTMYNAIYREAVGSTTARIEILNYPLNKTTDAKTEEYLESGTDLTVAINVIIALSFVPASFVVFLVNERITKAKHLQFVSGVDALSYWSANYLWDLINYMLPAFVCLMIFLAFSLPAYTGRNFGPVVVLVLLYGFSITPVMYCASWLFNIPSTAYVALICTNLFVGLTCTLTTFILELFPEDEELTNVNSVLLWVFLVFPNYALGRGLVDLARNEYIAQYQQLTADFFGERAYFKDPFDFHVIGRNVVFMIVTGAVFFLVALWIEFHKNRRTSEPEMPDGADRPEDADSDVADERERVSGILAGGLKERENVLVVDRLTKVYNPKSKKKRKLAVNQLCLGVEPGVCFGLLGVNGAGKTSTFKMLTTDSSASAGEAYVCAKSIHKDVAAVQQRVGYCPQFDALVDLMTGREMLHMIARVRGVPEAEIPDMLDWMIEHMQLTRWADKVTRSYSGGNKRKLSVALALLGRPPLLFMDEPTSGMDVKARRFLWDLITNVVREGRSVVLTSHSMEECEALCTRLAIMVNGSFQCLGSPQHLKSKYGNGYTIIIQVRGAPPDTEPVEQHVQSVFPHIMLKESHNGYLRYQLPTDSMPSLATVFQELETAKAKLAIDDYSVGQTSLDEIFCNFAARQEGEDGAPSASGVDSQA